MTLQQLHAALTDLLAQGVPPSTPVHLQIDKNELGNGEEVQVVEYIAAYSHYPGGPLHPLIYPDQQPEDEEVFTQIISITT